MKRRPGARQPGFTLIEVLAALVIVALGMLGAIEAVNQSTRNATYLREKTLAHWIAMNLITERRLRPDAPPPGEQKGEVDFAGERWQWTLRVTQTAVQSMRRMDIAVRRATAPEGTSLANASGFYGTAIGVAGGGSLSWSDSARPSNDGEDEDSADSGRNQGNKIRRRPRTDTEE